jgi:hypothetical protein
MKAGPSRVADPLAHGARKHLSDVLPDVAAAVQEKNQREQRQQRAGHDLGEGSGGRQGTAGQLLLMAAQRPDRRVAGVIYLVSAQPQRTVDQPIACAVNAFGDPIDEAR